MQNYTTHCNVNGAVRVVGDLCRRRTKGGEEVRSLEKVH